jgi:hypothetical protein
MNVKMCGMVVRLLRDVWVVPGVILWRREWTISIGCSRAALFCFADVFAYVDTKWV